MAENWAESTRTVDYQANTTFNLNQTPGLLYPLAGSSKDYHDKSSEIEDQFDDDFNLVDKEARNSDTNNRDANSTRRWIKKPKSANVAPLLDRDDAKSTRVDIHSPLVMGTAKGVRRYHDDMFLTGFFGNAWTGENGDVAVPFKSANKIQYNFGGTSVGLTEDKLQALAEMMDLNDVDTEAEQPIILITPKQHTDLLKIDRYVNSRYTETRKLDRRELKPYLNFRFFKINLGKQAAYPRSSALTWDSVNSVRRLPVFVPSGLHRGVWTEFYGRITERDDKNFSQQVYAEACSAVTRLMEDKCYILECKEG